MRYRGNTVGGRRVEEQTGSLTMFTMGLDSGFSNEPPRRFQLEVQFKV